MCALQVDPRGRRAGMYGFRIMRLGLLCVVGIALMVISITTWNTDSLGNANGWASRRTWGRMATASWGWRSGC